MRIDEVRPLDGYRLWLRFSDGHEGIYEVEPARRSGVFSRLCDVQVFNAVAINPDFGCVEWPGGIDLCPSSMRKEMGQAEGKLLL